MYTRIDSTSSSKMRSHHRSLSNLLSVKSLSKAESTISLPTRNQSQDAELNHHKFTNISANKNSILNSSGLKQSPLTFKPDFERSSLKSSSFFQRNTEKYQIPARYFFAKRAKKSADNLNSLSMQFIVGHQFS